MKKQNKRTGMLAVAALLLVTGYLIVSALMPEKEKWVYVEEVVKRGTLVVNVTENGSLEYGVAPLTYDLDIEEGELLVEEIYAAAGQRVQAGDALVRFSWESVEKLRRLLENDVVAAEASCLQAQHDYELAAMELKTAYDNAKISQEYASGIYEDKNQAVNNAITAMDKEITLRREMASFFQSEVENAQNRYDEINQEYQEAKRKLTAVGTKNVPNYLMLNEAYQKAQNKYFDAQNTLETAKETQADNERRITELEAHLADAKARIVIDKLDAEAVYNENTLLGDNAQTVFDAAIADLKKVPEKEEALLKEKEERLADFNALVGAEGIVYAPKQTIITEIACQAGDCLTKNAPLLTYAEELNLLLHVTQENVVALKQDDPVEIRFALHPDKVYKGVIRSIGSLATIEEESAVRYQVLVSVADDIAALYSGMEAEVTFTIAYKENALYVSQAAIVEEAGRTYVYVQSVSGDYVLKEVETGIRCEQSVEILSGLNEGDIIYVLKRAEEVSSVSGNAGDTAAVSSGDEYERAVSEGDALDRRTGLE